jgi:hypothetical protein
MGERWQFQLLGGFGAQQAERVITRFQTHKTGALLAYLAYHRTRPHPREELIALFWPESALDQGRTSLSVALSSLRHQLEPPGVPAASVLLANCAVVQLNPEACATSGAAASARHRDVPAHRDTQFPGTPAAPRTGRRAGVRPRASADSRQCAKPGRPAALRERAPLRGSGAGGTARFSGHGGQCRGGRGALRPSKGCPGR